MTAEYVAKALGGRLVGATWMARCPAHDDREPSLAIIDSEGKVLVFCHAGCTQRVVIAALLERGIWQTTKLPFEMNYTGDCRSSDNPSKQIRRPSDVALAIWKQSQAIAGTPVATYLRSRSLDIPNKSDLRFHSGLKHPSGGVWPSMVALVTHGETGLPLAIHRTFLDPTEFGKAPVTPAKMMLGPCRGGVVRLGEITERLMIAEGIETALSAMQATGYPAWAALSTSGMRALNLPIKVRDVIVLADGDAAGAAAAQNAAQRWAREARRVRIAHAPSGLDFNDMLRGGRVNAEDLP